MGGEGVSAGNGDCGLEEGAGAGGGGRYSAWGTSFSEAGTGTEKREGGLLGRPGGSRTAFTGGSDWTFDNMEKSDASGTDAEGA